MLLSQNDAFEARMSGDAANLILYLLAVALGLVVSHMLTHGRRGRRWNRRVRR